MTPFQLFSVKDDKPWILTQHRIAWLEQFVLRAAGVPHLVVNSGYAVMEATGPLPCIQSICLKTHRPYLVGRHQPICSIKTTILTELEKENVDIPTATSSNLCLAGNEILRHLRDTHKIDLDYEFQGGEEFVAKLDPLKQSQSLAFISLIKETLNPILDALFCDSQSYQQIYLPMLRETCTHPYGHSKMNRRRQDLFGAFHLFAAFQTFFDRCSMISSLRRRRSCLGPVIERRPGKGYTIDIPAILRLANDAYAALNNQLYDAMNSSGSRDENAVNNEPTYFFATNTPTNLDAFLFDHLARAMSNPHLLALLSHHSALKTYFIQTFNRHFGPDYTPLNGLCQHGSEDQMILVKASNFANFANPSGKAVFDLDLLKVIAELNIQYKRGDIFSGSSYGIIAGERFHKIRFGGDLLEEKIHTNPLFDLKSKSIGHEAGQKDARESDLQNQMENIRAQAKKNDTLWLTSIAAGVTLVLLLAQQ